MFKKLILLLGMLCCILRTDAQHNIYLTIDDPSIISSITVQGKPAFTISGINTLVNQYPTLAQVWRAAIVYSQLVPK